MSVDINKILTVSARIAFALLVSCLILIFFPAAWLPFDISSFREEYGIWLFFVMVLSVSILFSYIAKWCVVWVKKLIDRRKLWNGYKYILENLSDDEKLYLKPFYEKRQTAIMVPLMSPVAKKLETFKVISKAAGTSLAPGGFCPGFIQPWVFELIDKHPDYLNIRSTEEKDNA